MFALCFSILYIYIFLPGYFSFIFFTLWLFSVLFYLLFLKSKHVDVGGLSWLLMDICIDVTSIDCPESSLIWIPWLRSRLYMPPRWLLASIPCLKQARCARILIPRIQSKKDCIFFSLMSTWEMPPHLLYVFLNSWYSAKAQTNKQKSANWCRNMHSNLELGKRNSLMWGKCHDMWFTSRRWEMNFWISTEYSIGSSPDSGSKNHSTLDWVATGS